MYREYLQKIIGFDKWHLNTLNERFYAVPTIKRINGMICSGEVFNGAIIEVGCGLGDIISAVRWKDKLGYDIDRKAVLAARLLHPGTSFQVGTFDVIKNRKIAVLIALNFLHRVDNESCYRYFRELTCQNEVGTVVVDEVQSPPYQYTHDYTALFGKLGYTLKYRSRGYVANERTLRRILYFVKTHRQA